MDTKEYYKKYYIKNKDKLLSQHKKYWSKWSVENKEWKRNYDREYRQNNKDKKRVIRKRYCTKHKDKISDYHKQYRINNREKLNKKRRIYVKLRLAKDTNFKLKYNLSKRILLTLKKNFKSSKTTDLLGCTIEKARLHLESKFTEGMSWQNHGKWHIDHIKPCASFDLSIPEEQKKCFHYTNLQPLWAKENREKSNKLLY